MRLTRMAVFVSLWLLCVGLVGTASWYAIESAGKTTQVLEPDGRGSVARAASAGSTTPSARSTSETSDPEASEDPSSESSEPSEDASSSTTSSSSSSSTSPSDDRSQRSSTTRPSSRTTTPQAPRTTTTTTTSARTLLRQTPGGSVTVTCRADDPIDYVAKPAQGWGVRTNTQGALEADIKFSDRDETYEVHAKCSVDGEPSATVEHKQNDD